MNADVPEMAKENVLELPQEFKQFPLAFVVVLFPVMVAVLPSLSFLGMAFAVSLIFAYLLKCLKPFLLTLGISFILNLFIYAGATTHWDVDAYIAPQIRMIAAPTLLQMDGIVSEAHFALPSGFSAWCAAWYRLTGSIDCGAMLFLMLLPAAWQVLRGSLSRVQTAVLLLSPAAFPSLFSLMSDGCVYLLLLMTLVLLRHREAFWLPLLTAVCAAIFKTSAWIPCGLIALVLLRNHPRNWWKLLLMGIATLIYCYPTLRMILKGGLSAISSDFSCANEAAQQMGYWARLAYVYIGHWTTAAQPYFGAHMGGVDGGGVDGLGPLFRVAVMGSIVVLICCRKRLQTWWMPLLIAWGSILVMPTAYIGYARYVPWLYPAVMLPLLVVLPRLSLIASGLLCVMPALWLGWRVALSTEYVRVATYATAVSSEVYNVRCAFRDKLVATPQPTSSGSLVYNYQMEATYFPPMPRVWRSDLKQVAPLEKVNEVRRYALQEWLPWAIRHLPEYLIDVLRLRWQWFMMPRGVTDEFSSPNA